MKIDIQELINTKDVIDFLDKVLKGGVPISINDEIAIKSIIATAVVTAIMTGIITYITTYYATKATSKHTLSLFEKQEFLKIKEELRLEYYKSYSEYYKNFVNDFIKFKSNIESHKDMEEFILEIPEKEVDDLFLVKCECKKKVMQPSIDASKSLSNSLIKFSQFLDEYNEIYKDIDTFKSVIREITEINVYFIYLNAKYDIIALNIEDRKKIERAKEHNDLIRKIESSRGKLDTIIRLIENENTKVNKEFIGKYFN